MTDMTYRHLGDSGLMVSTVGLGCNNFGMRIDASATERVVGAALDHGITMFDTSDSYGDSEIFLSKALGPRRSEIVLATKFGSDLRGANGPDWGARGSRRYIRKAVERSLSRLGTDYIDLYQLHMPDPSTPIEETLSALSDLVHEGKVRYIGNSNFSGWQIADADWIARTTGSVRFISAQNHYNLIERGAETDVLPACERFGLGQLPYFPLAASISVESQPQPMVESRHGIWTPCFPMKTSTRSMRSRPSQLNAGSVFCKLLWEVLPHVLRSHRSSLVRRVPNRWQPTLKLDSGHRPQTIVPHSTSP
jgi:aryl-alcohol dehydrogenase-like predicted oxidoreductase